MTSPRRPLLILGCSRRKVSEPDPLPAVERYDGPAFRLYRRFLRSCPAIVPELHVLSAEFGLIAGEALIPAYDRQMTGERARELQPAVAARLGCCLGAPGARELFINVGQGYLAALGGEAGLDRLDSRVRIATGSTGRRLAELHDWLYGTEAPPRVPRAASTAGRLVLRGVPVTGDAAAALMAARRGLVESPAGASRYQVWYVPVDGAQVAPKWLVSRLTGLATGSFHTDEARRILAALGVIVLRNDGRTGEDGASNEDP